MKKIFIQMSSTFFPINEDSFIENIMNEIKKLKDIEDWNDVYHTQIDNEVSYLGNTNNIMIIDEYAGGVYEAIELYQDRFGEFIIPDKKYSFYAQLAFISVYEKFYGVIETLVEKINNEETSDSDYEIETDYDSDLTDDL